MSGIDWDKLKMANGGTIPPAAWNTLLDLIKKCYVAQVIGGERRDIGPHTIIDVSGGRGAVRTTHPWKAAPTGTENIAIAPGCVVGYRPAPEDNNDSPMRFPIVGEHVPFLGDEIEITAAEGTVYAHLVEPPGVVESQQTSFSYQGDLQEMWIHRSILYLPEVIELAFIPADTVPEEGGIYIPIATVTLADGIASVDYQILTHNPHIQLDGHSIDLDVESV